MWSIQHCVFSDTWSFQHMVISTCGHLNVEKCQLDHIVITAGKAEFRGANVIKLKNSWEGVNSDFFAGEFPPSRFGAANLWDYRNIVEWLSLVGRLTGLNLVLHNIFTNPRNVKIMSLAGEVNWADSSCSLKLRFKNTFSVSKPWHWRVNLSSLNSVFNQSSVFQYTRNLKITPPVSKVSTSYRVYELCPGPNYYNRYNQECATI